MDVLETNRLRIRPFLMDDLDEVHELLDKEIRWSGPDISRNERRKRVQREILLAGWEDTGRLFGYRAIVTKPANEIIGMCGFLPGLWLPQDQTSFWPQLFSESIDEPNRFSSSELELGYCLSPRHRGNGYATEAVGALVHYAFVELHVQRLFATTNRKNEDSIALMKRIGMRVASNPNGPDLDWPDGGGVAGVIENSRYSAGYRGFSFESENRINGPGDEN